MADTLIAAPPSTEPLAPRSAESSRARGAGGAIRFARARAIDIVLVMLAAATLSFVTLQLMPGNPVDTLLRGTFEITPEMRADVASAYGLDEPVWLQYIHYIGGLLTGDLGSSYQQRKPVTEIIAAALPPTAALAAFAMALAIVFALVGALVSAGRGRVARFVAQGLELVAIAVPSFWIGLILLSAFAFAIPLFPSTGADGFASLVLPALTLSLPLAGVLGQILRERLDETLEQPHTLTARTRGAGTARIRVRHGLRHSVIPALTVSGAIVGSLLVGTTVIETLFSRPGVGRVLLNAVMSKDAPVIMGVVIFSAIVFLLVNTVVDLLSLIVDPRTRAQSGVVGSW
ncbi:MAG TPA: ABC transporter permease [Microbacterium sp.]|nr:ABC transporter permease [Microbacterium sp.]